MAGLSTLITSIAADFLTNKLLERVTGNDSAKKDAASRVVEKLLKDGFAGLDLDAVSTLVPAEVATKVKEAIKKITRGDGSLSDDLIKTILQTCLGSFSGEHGALNRRFADTDDGRFEDPSHLPDAEKHIVGKVGHWFVYRIKNAEALKNLKNIGAEAEDLITSAFIAWQRVINLRILKIDPATGGTVNLEIVIQPLDGSGDKLAEATVGNGPTGTSSPYQLAIDLSEDWTREKFLYALVHEIGHLLGLDHNESNGDIMNSVAAADPTSVLAFEPGHFVGVKFKDSGIPSIAAAQAAWGPSPV